MRLLTPLLLAMVVAACAGQPAPARQPNVNLSGYPPAFRAGYADDCASVNAQRKRDEARFKSDADYVHG